MSLSAAESSNVSFHYHVDEDVMEGSVVADLSVDFTRVYQVDEDQRPRLRFLVFDGQSGEDQRPRLRFLVFESHSSDAKAVKRFDVDERTGILTTSMLPGRRLDREELCDAALKECVLTFNVVVQPYFQLVKVKVEDLIQGPRSSPRHCVISCLKSNRVGICSRNDRKKIQFEGRGG